jgi:spore coat polysaccharide biosynthesis predicted glycosyltransferase SpsG
LDQSLGRSPEEYKRFIVNDCELLLGPKYFIIREEIRKLKQIKNSTLKERLNILITLGGFAFSNIPVKIVSQLLKYHPELNMNFYMNFQYYHPCLNKHKNKEVSFFKTEQLTEVLPHVDFAITAAGMTLYEMVYLGIPTFILPLNELQKKVAFEICKLTPAKSIPDWKNTDVAKLAHSFVSFINSTLKKNKHKKAFQLIDGLAIDRIALKIEKLLN